MRIALTALVIAACGNRGEPAQAKSDKGSAPIPLDAAAPIAPVVTAPHGATVTVVAVTDTGDAAFTADELGELRFWPSLDGKHEPVVVHARNPTDLAMTRERDGFVVALLDAANGVELVHLTRDGGVRGRDVLAVDPGYQEIAAGLNAIIARRSDHAIVRLDTNTPNGTHTLPPQSGEQVLAIAARRASAFAGIADRERPTEINLVREIALGDLAWGTAYELPVPLAAPIAVSPSGKRIAGLHARTGLGVVVELVPRPHVIGSQVVGGDVTEDTLGFVDDERCVFRGGSVIAVPQADSQPGDPWSATRSLVQLRIGRGAVVADNMLVGGNGTHLVLAERDQTRFLGYRDLGVGFLRVTGSQITLGFGNRILWLDESLAQLRSAAILNDAAGGIAIDDHRLLKATYSYLEDDRSKLDISIYDTTTEKEDSLGSWTQGSALAYDPGTHVFAVSGYLSAVPRLQLDPITKKVTPLPALRTKGDATVELFDPSVTGGTVAIAYSFTDAGMHLETFGDQTSASKKGPLSPKSSITLDDVMFPIGAEAKGVLYSLAARPADEAKPLYGHKDGKQVKRLMVDGHAAGGAVDRAGTMLALFSSSHVFVIDMAGTERWRIPAWSVNLVRFTEDGKTLLVNTQGGLFSVDTATGKRRATGCGWGFGLSTEEPQLTVFMTPVVCAEAAP